MSNKPVPQDHKKKTEKIKSEKATRPFRLNRSLEERDIDGWVIDYEGVEVFLPEESLADHHVVTSMAKMRAEGKTEGWRYPLILERLIGEEQSSAVTVAVTDPKTGRADSEKIGQLINVLFEAVNPNS